MSWPISIVLVLLAYLLGSVSFSYLIVLLLEGIDVRTVGSGNAGATNVLRAAGKGPAILALALDVGKGVAAVLVPRALGAPAAIVGVCGLAVVLGHVYPLFFGLRGGKGVATAAGVFFSLAWQPTLVAALVFLVLLLWKRMVSLGSISAAASIPLLVAVGGGFGWIATETFLPLFLSTLFIAGLVIFKHRENIQRLRAGAEPRLGERR